MKGSRRLLLAGGLLALAAPHRAKAADGSLERILAAEVLRAGMLPAPAPLSFVNAAGEPDGLSAAIAEVLASGLGVRLRLEVLDPRQNREAALLEGRVDVLLSGPPISVSAAKRMMFTDAFAGAPLMLVAPHGVALAHDAASGRPRIATASSEGLANPASLGIAPGATPRQIASPQDALSCMVSGECDAAILPEFAARWISETDARMEERAVVGQAWFGAAVRQGEHELWRALNGILELAAAEGLLQALHRSYLGRPLPENRPRF